jgi:hypothetical protein
MHENLVRAHQLTDDKNDSVYPGNINIVDKRWLCMLFFMLPFIT